ncbi:MAG: GNAT family N-acetyltransferase [Pirellulaceae bacterium]|nr:GNAT family N-acetyltransferase [Pirellulaceae bacterium]MDP7020362.1 GNAT family N-acetyltransferase [Pirellulaceae bacterium]
MGGFQIRNMTPDDRDDVARLIFHGTNQYYVSIGRQPIFSGDELSPAVMFDVYEQIDPGRGIVAVDDASGQIIGSCFVHPRETHFSLGIMNSHHEHFGRGVARALLKRITDDATAAGKPVRLVSSCFNLDSYSLYTRAGFVPFATFQDMILHVPEGGLEVDPPPGIQVRDATLDDVSAMAALEEEISGITRIGDYRYFIGNDDRLWHVSVIDAADGLSGFLVSCGSEALNMLGPGVARTEDEAAALLRAELDRHRGRTPVFLIPVGCGRLVRQLYAWGARNCEMHVAQSFGPAQTPAGVVLPTFLPESG